MARLLFAPMGRQHTEQGARSCVSPGSPDPCHGPRSLPALGAGGQPDPGNAAGSSLLCSEPENADGRPQGPPHHRQRHTGGLPQHARYRRGQICNRDDCILREKGQIPYTTFSCHCPCLASSSAMPASQHLVKCGDLHPPLSPSQGGKQLCSGHQPPGLCMAETLATGPESFLGHLPLLGCAAVHGRRLPSCVALGSRSFPAGNLATLTSRSDYYPY